MGWFSTDYSKGAVEVTGAWVADKFREAGFHRVGPSGESATKDDHYLVLTRENLSALVFKHHDTMQLAYHDSSAEFPDCDDFAVCAEADILKGAIKSRLKFAPVFAYCVVQRKQTGAAHALIAAIDDDGVCLYEPQKRDSPEPWIYDLKVFERLLGVDP